MVKRFRGHTQPEIWASYFWDGIEEAHDDTEAGVLENKGNERTHAGLEEFERKNSAERQIELYEDGIPGGIKMSPDGYKKIHEHLFQDVYDWAGVPRECTLGKPGASFTEPQYIDLYLDDIFTELNEKDNLRGLSEQEFANDASNTIHRLNVTHPFREGNGRTNRAFLQELGRQAGHDIDLTKIDADAWMQASKDGLRFHATNAFAEIIEGAIVPRDYDPEVERAPGDEGGPDDGPDEGPAGPNDGPDDSGPDNGSPDEDDPGSGPGDDLPDDPPPTDKDEPYDRLNGWQPGNPPPLQAPDERAFTPSGSGGPGELSDEEEQRKMVKYHMEEKPWMREQMQKDHERDSRQFEENAMRQDAEAIERERDQADQNQAGEPEYDAGSAIERAQAQAAQRDGREAPTQRQEQPQDTRDQEQGHDAGAAIERAQAQAVERDRNRPIESDRDMDID